MRVTHVNIVFEQCCLIETANDQSSHKIISETNLETPYFVHNSRVHISQSFRELIHYQPSVKTGPDSYFSHSPTA